MRSPSARNDWGGGDFQDILDGVDLLEKEGVVDPQRLAIGGWSYGGYMAAWAVAHSPRFKTAIVGAGVIDIGAMALTTDTPDYLPGYFGDPLSNRNTYDEHSPIRHAGNIRVPVLILHGEQDRRVPLSQGEMLYRALRFNDTPVEMVTYPRGPHWFFEQAHGRDVQQRVLDWLDQQLGTEPVR
ncbi:MAG: Dipeptidyl-peptidase 5 [Stenotrophomonas maltophilia]|uniref:Dipeptidyl-peptidase 5 n=1 Tax=Stenotrophomonas maltophilia TaxID=40324 RepID=A0A7V8JLM6_STEMA|nr:MAG: Dipeptidyl-peptidase 5 [Stenotrophomonas maltophilia]